MAMPSIEQTTINTVRTLSMDAVQKANSGHPGTAMALAPACRKRWNDVLRFDPRGPIPADERLELHSDVRIPGQIMNVGPANMDRADRVGFEVAPDIGDERLPSDRKPGDTLLVRSADLVAAGWSVIPTALDVRWALPPRSLPNPAAGGRGRKEADDPLAHNGRKSRGIDA